MKKSLIYYYLFSICIVLIVFYSYSKKNETAQISDTAVNAELLSAQAVSDSDVEEAKKAVSDYFNALKTSDTVLLGDYLGYNMLKYGQIGPCNVNSNNKSLDLLYDTNFKPELIKIDADMTDLSEYVKEIKDQNNIDVYKILSLRVYFNYLKERDLEFILVKYNESSPWKIHYWLE
jgi:hypothetical protein